MALPRRPHFTTFRARVFWSVIPIVLCLSLVYSLIDLRERRGLLESEFVKRGQAMAVNLAEGVKLGVVTENQRALEAGIRHVLTDRDVAYVLIYGEHGRRLIAQGNEDAAPGALAARLAQEDLTLPSDPSGISSRLLELGNQRYTEFEVPVFPEPAGLADEAVLGRIQAPAVSAPTASRAVGAVRLGLSFGTVEEYSARLFRLWIAVTAVFISVSVLVIYHLSRRITLPIKRLTSHARRLAQGQLDQRIPVESGDEIGQLADTFNDMASALQQNIEDKERVLQELQELNRTLEDRIRERTSQLEDRTEALQRSLEEVRGLEAISRSVSSSLELTQVLETIARYAAKLSDSDACGIFEFNVADEGCEVVAAYDLTDDFVAQIRHMALGLPVGNEHATMRALHIPDLEAASQLGLAAVTLQHGFRAVLIVPMEDGTASRAIVLFRRTEGRFNERALNLLTALASQSRVAIENARLFKEVNTQRAELERLSRNLEQLYRLSTTLQEPLSLMEQLRLVLEAAREVVQIDRFWIWVAKDDKLVTLTGAGLSPRDQEASAGAAIPIAAAGAMQKAYREGVPLVFNAQQRLPAELRLKPPYSNFAPIRTRSFLVVPMMARGRTIGVLTADNKWTRRPILPATTGILQIFASHAAVAIENAALFRELEMRGHQLESASKHKSQFLANMSHELRTPLNAVLGYIELILDGIFGHVPADIRDSLERSRNAGHHLLGLINDILDLSKIEAGQLVLSVGEYSMGEVVHAVVTSMDPLAAERKLRLKAFIDEALPPGSGDVRRIKQVLMNLVGNAIKFTETGEVTIKVRVTDAGFLVAVSDTGPGIAPGDHQRIFGEFQQIDTSSTRRKGGTGLGLSIARRIVELHGGRIWLDSAPGEGATFFFTLPIRVNEPTVEAA